VNNDSASVWVVNDKPRPVTLKIGRKSAHVEMINDIFASTNTVNIPNEPDLSEPVALKDFTDDFFRKLREGENKFPTIDVEALAVVEGRHFTIVTDHRPLVHIFAQKTKSLRMTRWSHELSFYNYKLTYKLGASHNMPDLLSRKVSPINEILDPHIVAGAQREDPLWGEVKAYKNTTCLDKECR